MTWLTGTTGYILKTTAFCLRNTLDPALAASFVHCNRNVPGFDPVFSISRICFLPSFQVLGKEILFISVIALLSVPRNYPGTLYLMFNSAGLVNTYSGIIWFQTG